MNFPRLEPLGVRATCPPRHAKAISRDRPGARGSRRFRQACGSRPRPSCTFSARLFIPQRISVTPPAIHTRTPAGKRNHLPPGSAASRANASGSTDEGTSRRLPFFRTISSWTAGSCRVRRLSINGPECHLSTGHERSALAVESSPFRYCRRQTVRSPRENAVPTGSRRNRGDVPGSFSSTSRVSCPHRLHCRRRGTSYGWEKDLDVRCERKVDIRSDLPSPQSAPSDGPRRSITVDNPAPCSARVLSGLRDQKAEKGHNFCESTPDKRLSACYGALHSISVGRSDNPAQRRLPAEGSRRSRLPWPPSS